jgi:hypothetical protein
MVRLHLPTAVVKEYQKPLLTCLARDVLGDLHVRP